MAGKNIPKIFLLFEEVRIHETLIRIEKLIV